MTRRQRKRNRIADQLLCAAKHWQMGRGRDKCCYTRRAADTLFDAFLAADELDSGVDCEWDFEYVASAALSEAARLADTELVDAVTGE